MDKTNPIANLAEHIPEAVLPPMVGVGAIALQMAMQYADSTVVKDGAMYQQLRAEQKNIGVLSLNDVFEYAKQIEAHLMKTSDRIVDMVMPSVVNAISGMMTDEEDENGILIVRNKKQYLEATDVYLVGEKIWLDPATLEPSRSGFVNVHLEEEFSFQAIFDPTSSLIYPSKESLRVGLLMTDGGWEITTIKNSDLTSKQGFDV